MDETKNTEGDEFEDFEPTGESFAEDIELEEAEHDESSKIKKLQKQLKESNTEKMKHLEEMQRMKADFLNTRKRLEERSNDSVRRASMSFIESLLPLADSFDMAMSNTEVWQSCDENWRAGIEGIYAQLQCILRSYNVSVIDAVGKDFDPSLHEAVSNTAANDTHAPNTIVEVVQKGYALEDTIIRPARVIVAA